MVGVAASKDDVLVYSSIFFLCAVLFVALFFVFAFTQAGKLVVDTTRVRLRQLTHGEGRIRLTEDTLHGRDAV